MQRKATKNTRGRNSLETAYQAWLKEQPCAFCGAPGPSIVDHCEGSTFRHNKQLIGHIFCVSKCPDCDQVKTLGSHAAHVKRFGKTHSEAWQIQSIKFEQETGKQIPYELTAAIADWRR